MYYLFKRIIENNKKTWSMELKSIIKLTMITCKIYAHSMFKGILTLSTYVKIDQTNIFAQSGIQVMAYR